MEQTGPEIVIKGFEILECLGVGGMATVWKARQISLDRIVAIKVLSASVIRDASDIERFQSEARSAAKLKHSGIIQVYDADCVDNLYFIVMEYIAGYTVGDWLRRKGALSENETLQVADCIADALAYAWDHARIIHCDIKPDNVMVDADGTLKVADLGLSRTINAISQSGDSEEVLGTPAYMSPEQAMGVADLDPRADIYSLGAMMYHLLTGQMLFEGIPDAEVVELQARAQPTPIAQLNSALSRPMVALVERMLDKDRKRRPENWVEVRREINAVKQGLMSQGAFGVSRPRRPPTRHTKVATRVGKSKRIRVVEQRGASPWIPFAVIAFAVVITVSMFTATNAPTTASRSSASSAITSRPSRPPLPSRQRELTPAERFDEVWRWVRANDDQPEEGLRRYAAIAHHLKDTAFNNRMLEERIRLRGLMANRQAAQADSAWSALQAEVEALLNEDRTDDALARLQAYNGSFAQETLERRREEIERIRGLVAERGERERAEREARLERYRRYLDEVAAALVREGASAGLRRLEADLALDVFAEWSDTLRALSSLIQGAADGKRAILDDFAASQGQDIEVNLLSGRRSGRVRFVRGGRIYMRNTSRMGPAEVVNHFDFSPADLDVGERIRRIGNFDALSREAKGLLMGLMAAQAGSFAAAERFFADTHPELKDRLIAEVRTREHVDMEAEARSVFAAMLMRIGIVVEPGTTTEQLRESLAAVPLLDTFRERAGTDAARFRETYSGTAYALEVEPILRWMEAQ